MFAFDKNASDHTIGVKSFSPKQSALILTRPEQLTDEKLTIRNSILKEVHENEWWLKCGCCENPSTVLYTRKTKNTYTVCRNGPVLEHSPKCLVRTWGSHSKNHPATTANGLFHQFQDKTDIGRLCIEDDSRQRLSRQYASIRHLAHELALEHGKIEVLTHPSSLKHLSVAPGDDKRVFAALVTDKIESSCIYLPNGQKVRCRVTPADKVELSAKTWLVVIDFGSRGIAESAIAHPILSKADIVVVSNKAEFFLIKALRSLIQYWKSSSGKDVEARRSYRSTIPCWSLYEILEGGEHQYFGDVVVDPDKGDTETFFGIGTYALTEDGEIENRMKELRKRLTWALHNFRKSRG